MDIYHETHGNGEGRPLVLIHGALSGIGTSFGTILPLLAKNRRVIAVELQAHGRTPDVDRPLTVEHFAADVVEVLDRLGVGRADVYGWSMGAAVGLRLGTHHADRVGRLVLASVSFDEDGLHPGLLDGIQDLQPEHLHGSEFHEEYLRTAPDPAGWATLVTKMKVLDAKLPCWTPEQIRALAAPTMIVLADADIVQPEHAVRMFRLLGGAVPGDLTGLPACRLAILPGTTHTTIPQRADWLAPMIDEFLAEDGPEA
ncbi:alpha/beta fold hydrolase [Micromonospora violae]|uniref:alpha/beta fold hydrolase n=1 Tax=Micromonospora violae TaxID=1278207 RepID=UPI00102AC91A|nr:alpha/beta hydrolase [Micromonospora violae]